MLFEQRHGVGSLVRVDEHLSERQRGGSEGAVDLPRFLHPRDAVDERLLRPDPQSLQFLAASGDLLLEGRVVDASGIRLLFLFVCQLHPAEIGAPEGLPELQFGGAALRRVFGNPREEFLGFVELVFADHELDQRGERLLRFGLIRPLAGDVVADVDDPVALEPSGQPYQFGLFDFPVAVDVGFGQRRLRLVRHRREFLGRDFAILVLVEISEQLVDLRL